MDWLQTLLDNSSTPVWTAFLLGLLTALSPCPLATNIAAIGFIGKDIENVSKWEKYFEEKELSYERILSDEELELLQMNKI